MCLRQLDNFYKLTYNTNFSISNEMTSLNYRLLCLETMEIHDFKVVKFSSKSALFCVVSEIVISPPKQV